MTRDDAVRGDTASARASSLPRNGDEGMVLRQTQQALADTITAVHAVIASGNAGHASADATRGHLLCVIADEPWALPLEHISEVMISLPQLTPFPGSPVWMLGIFACENEVTALIDPAPLLSADADLGGATARHHLGAGPTSVAQPIIIEGAIGKLGMLVDEVVTVFQDDPTARDLTAQALPTTHPGQAFISYEELRYRIIDVARLVESVAAELTDHGGENDDNA